MSVYGYANPVGCTSTSSPTNLHYPISLCTEVAPAYTATNGDVFETLCGQHVFSLSLTGAPPYTPQANSFTQCMEYCSQWSNCGSMSYGSTAVSADSGNAYSVCSLWPRGRLVNYTGPVTPGTPSIIGGSAILVSGPSFVGPPTYPRPNVTATCTALSSASVPSDICDINSNFAPQTVIAASDAITTQSSAELCAAKCYIDNQCESFVWTEATGNCILLSASVLGESLATIFGLGGSTPGTLWDIGCFSCTR